MTFELLIQTAVQSNQRCLKVLQQLTKNQALSFTYSKSSKISKTSSLMKRMKACAILGPHTSLYIHEIRIC